MKETQEGCLSRAIIDFFERPLFKKAALSGAKSLFRPAEGRLLPPLTLFFHRFRPFVLPGELPAPDLFQGVGQGFHLLKLQQLTDEAVG
mgnify:CR=1 FL=1